ncbi:hypothetical protein ACIB24_00125 [Spongisporangium articulatum]|uniref:Uncharacterized protein n=1 Tax=Spongisporangium articulatum TaxID=3362603 RepID=A0ABW8AGH6_9ACTN
MSIGAVSPTTLFTAQVTNPSASLASVVAVLAARPDLAGTAGNPAGPLAHLVAQRQALANETDLTGAASSGHVDAYI